MSSLEQSVAPALEPITVPEAKLHARVTNTAEDSLLSDLIVQAREYIERETGRQLITATWVYRLDAFPATIQLLKAPVQSVTTLAYTDAGGDAQTLTEGADFTLDIKSEPARIVPYYGLSWPSTRGVPNAVAVTFTAGYGSAATDVPQTLKHWMLRLIGYWYADRDAAGIQSISGPQAISSKDLEATISAAMTPYRIHGYG